MGDFSWLHFSDLHFSANDNFVTQYAREQLLQFLKQNKLPCDYVFITGDIANKADYTGSVEFIQNLLKAIFEGTVEWKDRVFWAVGNHDISRRREMRNSIIEFIRKSGDKCSDEFQSALLNDEKRLLLTQLGMSEYIKMHEEVFKISLTETEINEVHRFKNLPDLNLIIMNTCLTSYNDNDHFQLLITDPKLLNVLEKIDTNKPVFAIGHHGKRFLHQSEEDKLSTLFDGRVDMYLCGHAHRLGYERFDNAGHEIHQLTCGGGMFNAYSTHTFMYGRYSTNEHVVTITPYSYGEHGGREWRPDYSLHRRLEENSIIDLPRLRATSIGFINKSVYDLRMELFSKTEEYYQRLTDQDGRFAYMNADAMKHYSVFDLELKDSISGQKLSLSDWMDSINYNALDRL